MIFLGMIVVLVMTYLLLKVMKDFLVSLFEAVFPGSSFLKRSSGRRSGGVLSLFRGLFKGGSSSYDSGFGGFSDDIDFSDFGFSELEDFDGNDNVNFDFTDMDNYSDID